MKVHIPYRATEEPISIDGIVYTPWETEYVLVEHIRQHAGLDSWERTFSHGQVHYVLGDKAAVTLHEHHMDVHVYDKGTLLSIHRGLESLKKNGVVQPHLLPGLPSGVHPLESFVALYYGNRSYIQPDMYVQGIDRADLAVLRQQYGAILLDVDGVLTDYHGQIDKKHIVHTLHKVEDLGFKVGVISNCSRNRLKELRTILSDYVSPRHIAGGMIHPGNLPKPDSSRFENLLDRMEVSPEESFMFGDQYYTDILGANRLGMGSGKVDDPRLVMKHKNIIRDLRIRNLIFRTYPL